MPEKQAPLQSGPAPLDLTLKLADRARETARLSLSHVSLFQPPLRVALGKWGWMSALPASEPIFQMFAFRLDDFSAQNPRFAPSQLSEIRSLFDRSPAGVDDPQTEASTIAPKSAPCSTVPRRVW